MQFALSNGQKATSILVRDLMEGEFSPRITEIDVEGVFRV